MRKTIKTGLAALAIALLSAACGGADDPAGSTSNGTSTGAPERVERQETNTAAAAPEPTRPQRIDDLLTPTAEPEPADAKQSNGENSPEGNNNQDETKNDPSQIEIVADPGELVPENPQLNDQILLQDIYARMDLEEFGLDPSEPVENGISVMMDTQMLMDHPYLHLTPDLKDYLQVEGRYLKGEMKYEKIWGYVYPSERTITPEGITSGEHTDISAIRGPITYFIYHPWFEPVFMFSSRGGRNLNHPDTKPYTSYRYEAGPYWFGENSLRGVLADTVEKLMEDAMMPDAEPFPRIWWKEGERRTGGSMEHKSNWYEYRDWTIGEFIRTTDSSRRDLKGQEGLKVKNRPNRERFNGSDTPKIDWEIIHPELPIIRVTAHANQKLPLIQAGVNPINRISRVNKDGIEVLQSPKNIYTEYSVSFVVAFQNRWTSFRDPNRPIIRFQDLLEPYEWQPQALDPELPYPNYWDDTDYMHHSIIGPVVMTVHDSAVLQRGTYSRVPKITRWDAPGHILTDEQVGTSKRYHRGEEQKILRTWPHMQYPNPGFPLPGHVMVSPHFGPGSETWRDAGMEGFDW